MCVVLDTNALASVFERDAEDHTEFEPVLNWISEGCGLFVYGGTRYKRELRGSRKYHDLLAEFSRAGKTILLRDDLVDACESDIKDARHRKKIHPKKFNDTHIMAIVIVSGCRVICTKDKKSLPYLCDRSFYPRAGLRPSVYTSKRNKPLLTNRYVATVCKNDDRGLAVRKRVTALE